jgi:hypothetical protein
MGMPGMLGEEEKKDRKVISVRLTELDKHSDVDPAEQVRPLKTVVIAATFPFKQQVEEFRKKLGLRSDYEVLGEAFRFVGVNVQRRELDGDGNPTGEFKTLDLNQTYTPYVILTGKRFEEEDPEVKNLVFPGLVMPRLKQFRKEDVGASTSGMAGGAMMPPGAPGGPGGRPMGPMGGEGRGAEQKEHKSPDQYPDIEKQLAGIQKTLEWLKGKNATEVAKPPERFDAKEFDIFSPGAPPAGPAGTEAGPAGPGMMKPGSGSRPGGGGLDTPGGANATQELELPEFCLVRLLDVTVEPGKTYEYRLQVRMANPNFGRKDVASPEYLKKKELTGPWSEVPIKVHIDPETRYYAMDQAEWERLLPTPNNKYRGPHYNENLNRDRQIILQAHRWLEQVPLAKSNPMLFGEWTVAERIPVYLGEYIGRKERIEAPVWRFAREDFVIASDTTTKRFRKGIEVYFGYAPNERSQQEAVLVDFEAPRHGYLKVVSRTEDGVKTQKVEDACGQEALIFRPQDGRLMLLEGARDFEDEQRTDRLKKVRDRIDEVKNKDRGDGAKKGPFGGGPGT